MTDPTFGGGPDPAGEPRPAPVIRDRRRIDPDTGRVRAAYADSSAGSTAYTDAAGTADSYAQARADTYTPSEAGGAQQARGAHRADPLPPERHAPASPGGREQAEGYRAEGYTPEEYAAMEAPAQGYTAADYSKGYPAQEVPAEDYQEPEYRPPDGDTSEDLSAVTAELAVAQAQAQERLDDLQRLNAEYINYRRRVERDRDVARDTAVGGVLESLLPVLAAVDLARQHGDLEGGPFAAIAEKLEATVGRYGLVRYGEPGEAFDPTVHEALMHIEAELAEGTAVTTVVQVLQPGYRLGDRLLRAARVAVADPN